MSTDKQIDTTTGTIKLKARFNNPGRCPFPNQFVNARMLVATENAVVIPTAALQMGSEGNFVWVLNSETRSQTPVKPGSGQSTAGSAPGCPAGDRVVTDGIDRLTEGAQVEVVEAQGHRAKPDAGDAAELYRWAITPVLSYVQCDDPC